MTEVLDARAVIVGSCTINNQMFPSVADFLTYMKGLKPQNKIGASFGSYGWSGEAVKLINKELEAMNFDLIDSGVRVQYVPDQDGKDACFELCRKIGGACIEACPAVFKFSSVGYIEVIELSAYPDSDVDEAIKYCPEDCIYWEEI